MQPLGMAVLEGSVSPGYRRRMSTLAASPAADLVTTDAAVADAGDSLSQPSPTPVPPIDVSNFFVTVSMGIGKPQPAGLKRLFPSLPHHLRHRVIQPLLPFNFPRDSTAE